MELSQETEESKNQIQLQRKLLANTNILKLNLKGQSHIYTRSSTDKTTGVLLR